MFGFILLTLTVLLTPAQVYTGDLICHFNGYNANCRYRLVGSAMTNIIVSVNKCNDPIDVTFQIKSDSQKVDWSHTFATDYGKIQVTGYSKPVLLEVELSFDNDDNLIVKAEFVVDNATSYFLNEPVEIKGLESCVTLNKAGRIAVGCLIALLLITGALLVVLLYYRHRRRMIERQNQMLVENIETPCGPDCENCQPTVRFDAQSATNQHHQNQNPQPRGRVTLVLSNGQIEGNTSSLPI